MFSNYKSPLGYVADGKKIDTYGVDHSGFSTKDEIEYQMARQRRENSLIEGYNNQGITKNYPQYGTNFWGKADNNYGFGSSNIADNIKNKQTQPTISNETSWYEKLGDEASKFGNVLNKEIKSDLADVGYGAKKALNGLTLGGSDWALRRLGWDNEDEYLAQKDAEGTGKAARIGGSISELGGNMMGLGSAIVKGLGKAGLKGTGLAGTSGMLEGMVTGATGSDTWSDLPQNMVTGSILGGFGGVAGQKLLDAAIKPFSFKASTYGLKGGLKNVINNPQAMSLVKRGIKQSDDIAEQALSQIPKTSKNLNNQTANMLQQSLDHKINLPQTIAAQKPKTEQYVLEHAADDVVDFAPREYFESIVPESKFNPSYGRTKSEYKKLLQDRAALSGKNLSEDINHFLRPQRNTYVRTLNNTFQNPDVIYTQTNPAKFKQRYYLKKYLNNKTFEPFFDMVILRDGKIFNKFNTDANYVANQFKMPMQDLSLYGRVSGNRADKLHPDIMNRIAGKGAVVNSRLPHISRAYAGLSGDARAGMQQAVLQGIDKSSQKAGSLESIYRIKNELDDMVLAAKNSNSIDYGALEQAQNNYSKLYANALKGKDKAFNLEQAYRFGLNNQSGALQTMTPLEKNAFSQGLFTQIKQNNGLDQNMAASALDYRSSLADSLRPNKFNQLEQSLKKNATQFNRLSEIGNTAENRLNLLSNQRLRGQGEKPVDNLNWYQPLKKLQNNIVKKSATELLNPDFVGTQNNQLLKIYPQMGGFIPTYMYFNDR